MTRGKYATETTVTSEQSRAEIERTLSRYGATSFAYGWEGLTAVVAFQAEGRRIKFTIPLPDQDSKEFRFTPVRGWERSEKQQRDAWELACRQRWRALALVVKAKLEAVAAGISEFEDEFLSHIVLPNGQTAGQWMRPQVAKAYETGTMPSMLALGPGK